MLYVLLDTQLPDAKAPNPDTSRLETSTSSTAARSMRERLIRFAATLIENAFHREFQVGLAASYSDRTVALPPGAGRGQRTALLDVLAGIDENPERSFLQTVAAVPRRGFRDSHVVVIGADPQRLAELTAIRSACRRLTVFTPPEIDELFEDDPHAAAVPGGEGA